MMPRRPNIIYILADDLGYGDLGCNNPESKIPTPHLNRLAAEGMRFTDAHAASAVCTPSRYNLLTGRYCWRSRLQEGVIWEWDGALIEPGRRTVADFLRDHGYHTACLGKWHLGWDWKMKNGGHPNDFLPYGVCDLEKRLEMGDRIDYTKPIKGGPVDRGFDTYFGIDVPNFPPYTWFEDDHLVNPPDTQKPDDLYGHNGPAVTGWRLEEMIPEFTRRAIDLIETRGENEENPYFLYLALTSPHSPVVPNEMFKGMSGAGNYGDFVCEVDWVVGQICDALKRTGTDENTLLIFTSDNGPEKETADDIGAYQRARELGHYSMGDLRGIKRDLWEGGHRVPFIARWPQIIPDGKVCSQLVSLGDFFATCAELTGADLKPDEAEDSVSLLRLFEGSIHSQVRDYTVYHSCSGHFAIRKGDWVFIDFPTGGDQDEPDWFREERSYRSHDFPGELFNLKTDPAERENCFKEQPRVVEELGDILSKIKSGRPTARSSQNNVPLSE